MTVGNPWRTLTMQSGRSRNFIGRTLWCQRKLQLQSLPMLEFHLDPHSRSKLIMSQNGPHIASWAPIWLIMSQRVSLMRHHSTLTAAHSASWALISYHQPHDKFWLISGSKWNSNTASLATRQENTPALTISLRTMVLRRRVMLWDNLGPIYFLSFLSFSLFCTFTSPYCSGRAEIRLI